MMRDWERIGYNLMALGNQNTIVGNNRVGYALVSNSSSVNIATLFVVFPITNSYENAPDTSLYLEYNQPFLDTYTDDEVVYTIHAYLMTYANLFVLPMRLKFLSLNQGVNFNRPSGFLTIKDVQ